MRCTRPELQLTFLGIFSESRGSWRVALLSPPPFHELEERPLNAEFARAGFQGA